MSLDLDYFFNERNGFTQEQIDTIFKFITNKKLSYLDCGRHKVGFKSRTGKTVIKIPRSLSTGCKRNYYACGCPVCVCLLEASTSLKKKVYARTKIIQVADIPCLLMEYVTRVTKSDVITDDIQKEGYDWDNYGAQVGISRRGKMAIFDLNI